MEQGGTRCRTPQLHSMYCSTFNGQWPPVLAATASDPSGTHTHNIFTLGGPVALMSFADLIPSLSR
jgi:hypothetical protein